MITQNIIDLPLDKEEELTIYVKDEEGNLKEIKIETVFIKKILNIVNIQPIELTEKKCLFDYLALLVCDVKKRRPLTDDELGLTDYEGSIKTMIFEDVYLLKMEEYDKMFLFNSILSLVYEVNN